MLFSHDDTFALTASDDCTVKVPLAPPLVCMPCALPLPPCHLTLAAVSSHTTEASSCGSALVAHGHVTRQAMRAPLANEGEGSEDIREYAGDMVNSPGGGAGRCGT